MKSTRDATPRSASPAARGRNAECMICASGSVYSQQRGAAPGRKQPEVALG